MAQIEIKRESKITHDEIYVSMFADTAENMEGAYSPTAAVQTKYNGILAPIVAINGLVVDMSDIVRFILDDMGNVPFVEFEFYDRDGMFQRFIDSGCDNIMRLQILPPADDMYKKINLDFFLTEFNVEAGVCSGRGEYKLSSLNDSRWRAFGEISTYDLFDKVSEDTGLGFASNVGLTEDKRYITAGYINYADLMEREIKNSAASATTVYDWWVDLWDNLVICDLYDRVNSVDDDEDMMVWEQTNIGNITEGIESEYEKVPALYTNAPGMAGSNLHIIEIIPHNEPISQDEGNNLVTTCWFENKKEYISDCIIDGDIEDDSNVFTRYEYLGEVYGDYNYLLAKKCRDLYLSKITSETLIIHTTTPQLCLTKGSQIRVVWYDNDSNLQMRENQIEGLAPSYEDQLAELGWLKDFAVERNENQPMLINLQWSGQYTVLGQQIQFSANSGEWDCFVKLTRPRDRKPKILQNIG